ncbi:alpha/beta-hydrolase family protein [Nanchangia anserum]|nr:alpha/beta-hydrolase family protein [Nanchangia anserum]
MPRPWWAQAIMSGALMVAGYLTGFVIDWLARLIADWMNLTVTYDPRVSSALRIGGLAALAVVFIALLVINYRSARRTAALVGMPAPSLARYVGSLVGAFAVTSALVFIYEAIYQVWRLVLMAAEPLRIPATVATWLAWALVAVIVLLGVEWGLIRQVVKAASRWASTRDRQTPHGVEAPAVAERSASPGSAVRWASTAREGKRYLGGAPMQPRIEALTRRAAREPVRVYSSLVAHGENLDASVEEAMSELRRTGAFSRSVILVVVPTGSGWVDEWNVQALEYLTGGDCASVAVQYSYLPSWMTFLSYREQAAEGGYRVIDAVAAEIARMDPAHRPRLFVTGESLGSYGAQAAFASPAELLDRVDGALWIGTPGFTELLKTLTCARHRGSPQIAPVVDNARHVRFATKPADLHTDLYGRELGRWEFPRIVYVQHASDPVVWWTPDLAWKIPDWIGERAGADVSPRLRWHRLVTCIQLLCDLPLAESAPAGHGHSYHAELVPAWRAILGLDPDEEADAAIAQAIAAHPV